MQHRGDIRVDTCVLSSALVVKLLAILLGIVPRSSVTTARNRVISSLLVPFALKGSMGTNYHASTTTSSSDALSAASPVVPLPAPTALANPTTLTLEMEQQMILSAFTAFGLSGNHKVSSKPWYFDYRASNHMTNTVVPLSNIRNYDGNLKINTADGSSLPISVVGDISSSLTDVFVSPDLSKNLIYVGQLVDQLVDNNCNVHFSRSSSCISCLTMF